MFDLKKFLLLIFFFDFSIDSQAVIPINVAVSQLLLKEVTSFYECHYAAFFIRTALINNLPLPNIPQRVISAEDVSFLLFTRRFLTGLILKVSVGEFSIRSSTFNPNGRIVLITLGYAQSASVATQTIVPVLLAEEDLNVVIVNWNSYAFYGLQYTRNITIPLLANIISQFTRQMIAVGASPKKMYFIGFSAGGEAVGLAAKQIYPKIARLLALDPEGSCYNFLPPSQRVSQGDADFVEMVHCSAGIRSLPANILGDVTFIVNGAIIQPQCANQSSIQSINDCSHAACLQYFIDSLLNFKQIFGIRCNSYWQYLQQECDSHDRQIFGFYTPSSAKGTYYVNQLPFVPSEISDMRYRNMNWF